MYLYDEHVKYINFSNTLHSKYFVHSLPSLFILFTFVRAYIICENKKEINFSCILFTINKQILVTGKINYKNNGKKNIVYVYLY